MLLKSFGNMRCQVDSVNIETVFYFRNRFQVIETMFCMNFRPILPCVNHQLH